MRKTTVTPLFHLTFADLMQLGDKAVMLIDRDAAELAGYGIDNVVRTFIVDKTEELKDCPTDEELLGDVIIATQAKDATADQLKVAVRSIMTRVKGTFGEQSGEYRKFGSKGMSEMNDHDLLQLGKRVVRIATLFLAQLAAKGLTQAIIDALQAIVVQYDTEIDVQDDAMRARDIATEDRIELGNVLYAKIVEVFDAGKDYWITKDEAKYNDYVIYGSSTAEKLVLIFATDQTNPDKMLFQLKAAADGKKVDAVFGDGSPEVQYTVNIIDYTLIGHTFINAGNFQAKLTGEIPAFDELIAPDNKIMASNLPEGLKIRKIDMGNNPQGSFALPLSCDTIEEALFFNNKFDQQSTNAFLIQVNGYGTYNGHIDLSGPDMAAPSGQGLAAKNQLIARGWTVITN